MGLLSKKCYKHHNASKSKVSSRGGRFGQENMRECGGGKQAAVDLVALQEATALLVLVVDLSVVLDLETQINIKIMVMEQEIKVATMTTSVMPIALFSR